MNQETTLFLALGRLMEAYFSGLRLPLSGRSPAEGDEFLRNFDGRQNFRQSARSASPGSGTGQRPRFQHDRLQYRDYAGVR